MANELKYYGFVVAGVEVKAGQSLIVKPGNEKLIHLSQVCFLL